MHKRISIHIYTYICIDNFLQERERERERQREGKGLIPLKLGRNLLSFKKLNCWNNSMIHIQINMLEPLRKKLCSKMLKQKVGVAPSKISTLLFSPQVCPVPKDIFKSHSILTGKVARTETFETHLAYAWHRIERHLSTLCFHLWIKIQRSISCCLPVDIGEGTWSKMNQWFKGRFLWGSGTGSLGVLDAH